MSYDAFISYRRESADGQARAIQIALLAQGKRCFLDVVDLGRGFFDEALLEYVAQIPNFIVILSPNSLDRCADPQDWLRLEITQAFLTGSNVIPVVLPHFTFPIAVPEELRDLRRHQWIDYSNQYFDAMIRKIIDELSPPNPTKRQFLPAPQPQPGRVVASTPLRTQPANLPVAGVSPPSMNWMACAGMLAVPFVDFVFWWVWLIVQLKFVKRIHPQSTAKTPVYAGIALIALCALCVVAGNTFRGIVDQISGYVFGVAALGAAACALTAVFMARASIERYYNTVEPIGLKLSWTMTAFCNVVYFQYHFQRILHWKKTGQLR